MKLLNYFILFSCAFQPYLQRSSRLNNFFKIKSIKYEYAIIIVESTLNHTFGREKNYFFLYRRGKHPTIEDIELIKKNTGNFKAVFDRQPRECKDYPYFDSRDVGHDTLV